jgi:two-component system, NarL family, nitrate/nitrite response regulator NarL
LIRKGIARIFLKLKHASPASLIQGIRETVEGRALFARDLLRRALEQDDMAAVEQSRPKFTERERQVLSFVFEGLANKQIADRLKISEPAVKASLQQLFAKTGVRTRSQLVRVALEQYRDQVWFQEVCLNCEVRPPSVPEYERTFLDSPHNTV